MSALPGIIIPLMYVSSPMDLAKVFDTTHKTGQSRMGTLDLEDNLITYIWQ